LGWKKFGDRQSLREEEKWPAADRGKETAK
jgi:hypothetical protein